MNTEKTINEAQNPPLQQAHVSGGVTSRPILFSTEMVREILAGCKTQTRRIIKNANPNWHFTGDTLEVVGINKHAQVAHFHEHTCEPDSDYYKFKCPYGSRGDILWVRETWWKPHMSGQFPDISDNGKYHYKADYNDEGIGSRPAPYFPPFDKWKPSIHMPKEACRIELRITDIRVERLHSLNENDAKREGVEYVKNFPPLNGYRNYLMERGHVADAGLSAKASFETLWAKINGQKSWNENPFVWVIQFERTEMPSKHHR